jgi:hypothetical protein
LADSNQQQQQQQADPDKYDGWEPADFYNHFGNWSKAIRALTAEGFSTSDIARKTNKLYQHVRNVQNYKPKRPANGTNKRQPDQPDQGQNGESK